LRKIRVTSNVFAPRQRCIALVAADDSRGLEAYREAGYETLVMNGNRKSELDGLIKSIEETLRTAPPRYLVLMTTDPAFERLCHSANELPHVNLAVWGPANDTPPELAQPVNNFRALEDLLPRPKLATVDVRLDFENLYVGLRKLGWSRDVKAMVQAIRDQAAEFGDVVTVVAYADWDWLAERGEPGLQRELFMAGVETRYQVNIHGKNSSDMVIARDIQSMLERPDARSDTPDIIILGTCDRDFRPTLQLAHTRRRRAVLLTLRRGLSELLRVVAGNDVRYLDERLSVAPHDERSLFCEPNVLARVQLADLVVQAEIWFRRQGRIWSGLDELADALAHGPVGAEWVRDAIEAEVLVERVCPPDEMGNCRREVQLARDQQLVTSARHLLDWVPGQIRHCLRNKGMPYVDTNYLFRGMRIDAVCQHLGVGQTRGDAENWLERLARARILTKNVQPHPSTPTNLIQTWGLSDAQPLLREPRLLQPGEADRRNTALLACTRAHCGQAVPFSSAKSQPMGLE
jgi:hypothetical protein